MQRTSISHVHVRLPAKLKKEAEAVITALGLDTSSAIRLFFTQLALQQTLPFPLPRLRQPSRETRRIVREALADDVIGPFRNVDSVLKSLYADD